VRLWEPGGGERLRLEDALAPVGCLAFAADGRTVAAAGESGTAVVWDLGRLLRSGKPGLDALWADLGADAPRAYRAVWGLASTPESAVPFLAVRLGAGPGFDELLARLIAELDHRRYAVREKATQELMRIGLPAVPALRRALAAGPSPEVRLRVERVLADIDIGAGASPLRHLRALEALERIGTPEARRALEAVAAAGPDAPLAREARGALARWK
jgi:hypothetical protein